MTSFVLSLVLSLTATSELHAPATDCRDQVIELIDESSPEMWNRLPPSLTSMATSNLILLLVVEAGRALTGWENAFSTGFAVNTAIDPVITLASHIVATNPPSFVRNFLSGPYQYLKRATFNTLLNSAVVLAMWQAWAAGHSEISITGQEAAAGFGLCAIYYFCIQFVKNKLFVELPHRFDAHLLQKMRMDLGPQLTEILERASKRAKKIEIDRSQIEALFMTAFEASILEIPFEDRVRSQPQLAELDSIRRLISKFDRPHSEKQNRRLRRKLLFQLLRHYDSRPTSIPSSVFTLGGPLTEDQSIQVLESLRKRYWRNKALVWTASIADQGIGVVLAGGILLRGLSEWAMTPGNPDFWTYFLP